MRARLLAVVGVATVLPLGLAMTGCQPKTTAHTDASAGASPTGRPADPKQALATSTDGLASGNFRFTVKDRTSTGSGTVHKPSGSAEINASTSQQGVQATLNFRMVGKDYWVKVVFSDAAVARLFGLPTKWMHLDQAKLTNVDELIIDFTNPGTIDKTGAMLILKSLVKAEQTGDGTYAGTIDLSQVKNVKLIDDDLQNSLGELAKAIPFKATVDPQGRLTSLVLEIPEANGIPAHTVEITFSDYGAASAVTPPPAGETVEAPPGVYEFINS